MRPEEQPAAWEITLSTPKHTYEDDGSGVGCEACPMLWNHPIHDVTRPSIADLSPVITVDQSATSQAAGEAARLRLGSLRAKAYSLIVAAPNGATTDEIEVALERSHQSVSSAIHTLRASGYITPLVADGQEARRDTRSGSPATVYVAVATRVGVAHAG